MDNLPEKVEIKCYPFKSVFDGKGRCDVEVLYYSLFCHLDWKPIDGYKLSRKFHYIKTVSAKIDEKNVEIQEVDSPVLFEVDVCLVEITPEYFRPTVDYTILFTESCKEIKTRHRQIPIILYEDECNWKTRSAKGKNSFKSCYNSKKAFVDFLYDYGIIQARRNQILKKIGAVNYVKWNSENGRGTKILLDEIAHTGLGKLMEERNLKKCCEIA